MLATVGWLIVDMGVHLPGLPAVGPIEAHNVAVNSGAMLQILCAIGVMEAFGVVALKETLDGGERAPGIYYFDPLSLSAGKSDKVSFSEAMLMYCDVIFLAPPYPTTFFLGSREGRK